MSLVCPFPPTESKQASASSTLCSRPTHSCSFEQKASSIDGEKELMTKPAPRGARLGVVKPPDGGSPCNAGGRRSHLRRTGGPLEPYGVERDIIGVGNYPLVLIQPQLESLRWELGGQREDGGDSGVDTRVVCLLIWLGGIQWCLGGRREISSLLFPSGCVSRDAVGGDAVRESRESEKHQGQPS